MAEGGQCLIIVPQSESALGVRLREHFAGDARIIVRVDGRTGDRESQALEVFAVGGGDLDPSLRAYVDGQVRDLMSSLDDPPASS